MTKCEFEALYRMCVRCGNGKFEFSKIKSFMNRHEYYPNNLKNAFEIWCIAYLLPF